MSSTILLPNIVPHPLEDDDLTNLLQQVVSGVTGIDPQFVRPRWQPTPPTQPASTTDWVSVGIERAEATGFPYEREDDSGAFEWFSYHEELVLKCTFYGPNSQALARILRDGLYVAQNRESLIANNIDFVGTSEIIAVPELISQQWIDRRDINLTFRRNVVRQFAIKSVISASSTIVTDEQ